MIQCTGYSRLITVNLRRVWTWGPFCLDSCLATGIWTLHGWQISPGAIPSVLTGSIHDARCQTRNMMLLSVDWMELFFEHAGVVALEFDPMGGPSRRYATCWVNARLAQD